MNIDRLIAMANDIGDFFDADPDKAEAARGIASHLQRFWDPRMRVQIAAYERNDGSGLKEVVRAAIRQLPPVTSGVTPSAGSAP